MLVPLAMMMLASSPTPDTLLQDLRRHFWDEKSSTYREFAPPANSQRVFLWGGGVLLSAFVAAGAREPRHRLLVQHWIKVFEPYRFQAAYNPAPSTSDDRYYDDNAWVALALVEAHEAWGEPGALPLAEQIHGWVMTGESPNGGIYWHIKKESRNTCSTANTALVALKLYAATRKPEYLAQASRLLSWMQQTLRAPSGLYWDNIQASGKIEKTFWSYNTALPIRAFLERYRQLKDPVDLKTAVWLSRAARHHWQNKDGAIACDAAFAHHLAEAWWELAPLDPRSPWRNHADRALAYALTHSRTRDGLFGKRWEAPPGPGLHALLPIASAARAAWKQPN